MTAGESFVSNDKSYHLSIYCLSISSENETFQWWNEVVNEI